jgi:branched-chain amino acid transport system ATP-binding protein
LSLLSVEEVSVRFGGVMALQDVDLTADPGMVTGLIGPNGAGKTTLFNVITGLQDPTSGKVLIDGEDVSGRKAHQRARLGLARTFQRLEVFGSLTARENVLVAAEIRRRWSKDGSNPKEVTEEILERVGITAAANGRVDAMPTGLARLVELARALAANPRLLLLDEPASGLSHEEVERLAGFIRALSDEFALTVLLVEHHMNLVMRVSQTVHVLDFGKLIASGTPDEVRANPAVIEAYLGPEDDAAA